MANNNATHEQRQKWGLRGAVNKWSKEPPFEERFWGRVDIRSKLECWNWKRSTGTTGYGKVVFKKGGKKKYDSAHRIAFEFKYGKIPSGVYVLHRCDNRACCNPDHLFIGSQRDNNVDKIKKGRHNVPYGEQHHGAAITADTARAIRSFYGKMSHRKAAKAFGVSRGIVEYIWYHHGWKHA